jgi:Mn2+/Fe2+ NRAMP family transporter
VQEKGWKVENLKSGLRDSYIGVGTLGLISMLIIITSASALFPRGIEVKSAGDMAIQLESLFGSYAKYIFSFGLCAAAFSSLIVNPVIGAGLLSDSLGLGRSMDAKAPKIVTVIILLTGMSVAIFFRGNVIYALIIAQAATLVGVPMIAIGITLLLNNKKVMGEYKNTITQNIFASLGFILISIMLYFTAGKIISYINNL